ncbi:MAG: hypothetical protein V3U87_10930, partial [Methylococcaceae bacterium]
MNSVEKISDIPSITVPTNKWIQISLNTAPQLGSTVDDVIGDDISAAYGIDWVVFSYQTSTNTYQELSLTDVMLPGVGYWFMQATGIPVTIDMPNGGSNINLTHDPECFSHIGCYEILLDAHVSDIQWQMI